MDVRGGTGKFFGPAHQSTIRTASFLIALRLLGA